MRNSPGARKLRDAFYAGGCKGVTGFQYRTGEAAWETAIPPNVDWHNTAFQVGGFTGTAVKNADGTVTFTITNYATRESFLYHLPVGNTKEGPMRTIKQTFEWTEPIPKCCDEQK